MNEIGQTFEDIDHTKDLESKQAQTLLAAIEPKTDALTDLTKRILNAEVSLSLDGLGESSVTPNYLMVLLMRSFLQGCGTLYLHVTVVPSLLQFAIKYILKWK